MKRVALAIVFLIIVGEIAGAQTADLCTNARNYEKAGYSNYWSRNVLAQCPAPALPATVSPPAQKATECSYYLLRALKTEAIKQGAMILWDRVNDPGYVAARFSVDCASRESLQKMADIFNNSDLEIAEQATVERRHQELVAALRALVPPAMPIVPKAPWGVSAMFEEIHRRQQRLQDQQQRDNAVLELQRIGFTLDDINAALRQLNIQR